MKRSSLVLSLVLVGLVLPGCPIYGEDDGCVVDSDCPSYYVCDAAIGVCRSQGSDSFSCNRPSDCDNSTCSKWGDCRTGDCSWSDIGCVSGYVCSKADRTYRCVPEDQAGEGNASGGTGAGTGGASSSEGGAPPSSSSGGAT